MVLREKCLKLPKDVYWFGTKELGSVVVVRDCYPQFWSMILTECDLTNGVIVTGFLYTYDEDRAAVVYDAATEYELQDAMLGKKVYYICDGVKPFKTTGLPTILISLPAPDILRKFSYHHNTLFMDIWSEEELDILKQHYPNLPNDVYEELLEWYGPVPRWCLEQTKKGRPLAQGRRHRNPSQSL